MRPSSISATLAEGMSSSLRASSRLTCRSSPCTVITRSFSIAPGSAACAALDASERIALKSKLRNGARLFILILAPRSSHVTRPPALAGERRNLIAHPVVAFVTIVARMPEETHREGDGIDRQLHAGKRELLLQDRRERGWKREQRIAVEREQQPGKHRWNLRRDEAGEPLLGELAVEQIDGGKRAHSDVVAGGEGASIRFPLAHGVT